MKKIIIIATIFLLSGCAADDNIQDGVQGAKDFYTVEIGSDFNTNATDNWVLASDAAGRWLDAQPFETGETIILHGGVPTTNFNITFLSVSTRSSGESYFFFRTYTDVPVQGNWHVKGVAAADPTNTSNDYATIKLLNFDGDLMDIQASILEGNVAGSRSQLNGTVSMQVRLLRNPTDLILSFRSGDSYKTTTVENVTPNSTTTIDALQVNPPQKNFSISFANNTFYYVGFYGFKTGDDTNNNGYIISEHIDNDGGVPPLTMGYNPGFDKYKTIISYGAGNYYNTYYKFGSAIQTLPTFIQPSISVSSNSIRDFALTSDSQFSIFSASFYDPVERNMDWEVTSPWAQDSNIAFSIEPFPARLKASYPNLSADDIVLYKGTCMLYLDEFTYNDFISNSSGSGETAKPDSDEYYSYGWSEN